MICAAIGKEIRGSTHDERRVIKTRENGNSDCRADNTEFGACAVLFVRKSLASRVGKFGHEDCNHRNNYTSFIKSFPVA